MQPYPKNIDVYQPHSKFILLVEDDPVNGQMLSSIIQQETSYLVFLVSNGAEALRVLHNIVPDLILLDYALPDMNGRDVYEHFTAKPALANVPVILLTACPYKADMIACHIPYIAKPYDLDTLLQALHQNLACK